MPLEVALQRAFDRNLDLVEVDARGTPPVCKIMNYGKYKYETSKKVHGAKKTQVKSMVKEVKFRPRTDEHDLEFKLNHAKRFLDNGHKVKISIWFRGREKLHVDYGRQLLDRIMERLKDEVQTVGIPRFEGRNLSVILSPKKKVEPKKVVEPSEADAALNGTKV